MSGFDQSYPSKQIIKGNQMEKAINTMYVKCAKAFTTLFLVFYNKLT